MKKYEYRNTYLKQQDLNNNIYNIRKEAPNKLYQFNIEAILNQWGSLNWELIDFEYELSREFVSMTKPYKYPLNIFLFFKRELNEDLTPNKSTKYEYRVLIEDPKAPFNSELQDEYFLKWIKDGFEIIKNIAIKLPSTYGSPLHETILPFNAMIYIFKRKIG